MTGAYHALIEGNYTVGTSMKNWLQNVDCQREK